MTDPVERGECALSTQAKKPVSADESAPEVSAQRLVYFAAERTLLSWIRVALGLMALGFVVDRFQLVLQSVMPGPRAPFQATGAFAWIGAVLVGLGIATSIVASIRYLMFHIRYHRQRTTDPGPGLVLAVGLAVAVAAVGTVIVVVLAVTSG